MVRMLASLAIGLGCALGAVDVSAQNLLTNGGFDGSSSGWSVSVRTSTSSGTYSPTVGYLGPGSLNIYVGIDPDWIEADQCVNTTAARLDFAFYSKEVFGAGGSNIGTGEVQFYASPDCVDYIDTVRINRVTSLTERWKHQTRLDFATPAGMHSAMAMVHNYVQASVGDTAASTYFDDISLSPAGTFDTSPATPNRIVNPQFDTDANDWILSPVTDHADVAWAFGAGYGGPIGSLRMDVTDINESSSAAQCIVIDAQAVDLEVYSKIVFAAASNTGTASVSSYTSTTCTGLIETRTAPVVSTDAAGWRRFALLGYSLPAQTHSALVRFSVSYANQPGNGSIDLVVDKFTFSAAGAIVDVLFTNGFE